MSQRYPVFVSGRHSAAVVLSVLLGWLGVDRMYTGRVVLGICKLLFGWMTFGVWWLIDIMLVATGRARDRSGNPLIVRDDGSHLPQQRHGEPPLQLASISRKHFTAVILSVLLGLLGIDRFYTGRIGLGILKLLTQGGFFVWWIVDICLMGMGTAKDNKGDPLIEHSPTLQTFTTYID